MKFIGLLACLMGIGSPGSAAEITVFAASSLKSALDQIAADWQAGSGNVAQISYDSSSRLAQQILQGAPADLFFSASDDWMDQLEAAGMIQAPSRVAVLGNELVLVAHGHEAQPVALEPGADLLGLLAGGTLAMGRVTSVPAGQYGKQALEHLGLWQDIAPHVAEAESARAALALAAQGEAALAIVFASDAIADDLAGDRVSVVGVFPAQSHAPITFPMALMPMASPIAADFAAYLRSEPAREVFVRFGFEVLP